MSVFLNSRGDLRTIWKFAAFISVWMPVWIAVSVALRLVFNGINSSPDDLHRLALDVVINLIPAVVATVFAARIVEDMPVQALGLGLHGNWKLNLVAGFSIGGFLLILVVAGAKIIGEFQLEWAPYTNPGRMVLTLGILIIAAAFENIRDLLLIGDRDLAAAIIFTTIVNVCYGVLIRKCRFRKAIIISTLVNIRYEVTISQRQF